MVGVGVVADADSGSKTVMGSGIPAPEGSGLGMANEDELALGEASADDDILLSEESGGSAIDLAEDVDDDLVLGGSSHGDLSRTGAIHSANPGTPTWPPWVCPHNMRSQW